MKKHHRKILIIITICTVLIAMAFFVNRLLGYPKQYRTNNASYIDYQENVIKSIESQYSVNLSFAEKFDEDGVKTATSSKNVYSIKTADIVKKSSFIDSQKIGNYISFDIFDADNNAHLETRIYLSKKNIDSFVEEPPLTAKDGEAITINGHPFTVHYIDASYGNGCVFTSSDFNGYHVLGQVQYTDSDAEKNSHEYLISGFLKEMFPK